MTNYSLPPNPQHAVLKKIYPWDQYDKTLVMQWLYKQASLSGFTGNFEEFKLRYGTALDEIDLQQLIENYEGAYHVSPQVDQNQVLPTQNKILDRDIIVDGIPSSMIEQHERYQGQYSVTPQAFFDAILRTKDKIVEDDIIIEQIPYTEVSNEAGGTTVIIG